LKPNKSGIQILYKVNKGNYEHKDLFILIFVFVDFLYETIAIDCIWKPMPEQFTARDTKLEKYFVCRNEN